MRCFHIKFLNGISFFETFFNDWCINIVRFLLNITFFSHSGWRNCFSDEHGRYYMNKGLIWLIYFGFMSAFQLRLMWDIYIHTSIDRFSKEGGGSRGNWTFWIIPSFFKYFPVFGPVFMILDQKGGSRAPQPLHNLL